MRLAFHRHPWFAPLVLALAFLAAAPRPAGAQGGFLKKAKDKLAGAAQPAQPAGPAPQFTDDLLEITDARIDAYLKGVAAGCKVRGASGLSVAELNRRAEQAFQKRDALQEGKDDERQKYEEQQRKYDDCVDDQLSLLQKEHEKAMQAKMMGGDMTLIQKLAEASAEVQKKYAAGDTAGAAKAQKAMMKLYGFDPDADTLAARAKCGKAPVKPKWMSDAEAQLKLGNASMDEARALEMKTREERAKAAGLTPKQFGLVNERILAWLNADGKPGSIWKFSGGERDALGKRQDELKKAVACG